MSNKTYRIILMSVCAHFLIKCVQGAINVARTDTNSDIVLYINGVPLRAQGVISIPQYAQTAGIVLANGQRIPAGYSAGVTNIRISMQRMAGGSYYAGAGYGNGVGYGTGEPVINNYYYSSNPSGPYGNGVGSNYGSNVPNGYGNGYGQNGYGTNYGNGYGSNGYGNNGYGSTGYGSNGYSTNGYNNGNNANNGYRQRSGFEQFLDSINIFRNLG